MRSRGCCRPTEWPEARARRGHATGSGRGRGAGALRLLPLTPLRDVPGRSGGRPAGTHAGDQRVSRGHQVGVPARVRVDSSGTQAPRESHRDPPRGSSVPGRNLEGAPQPNPSVPDVLCGRSGAGRRLGGRSGRGRGARPRAARRRLVHLAESRTNRPPIRAAGFCIGTRFAHSRTTLRSSA